jgi:hypothetical protein
MVYCILKHLLCELHCALINLWGQDSHPVCSIMEDMG